MAGVRAARHLLRMGRYVLCHRHAPEECGVAFAAWSGFMSPLRRLEAAVSCRQGDHRIWWVVDAATDVAALALLPAYIAERTEAVEVEGVVIP